MMCIASIYAPMTSSIPASVQATACTRATFIIQHVWTQQTGRLFHLACRDRSTSCSDRTYPVKNGITASSFTESAVLDDITSYMDGLNDADDAFDCHSDISLTEPPSGVKPTVFTNLRDAAEKLGEVCEILKLKMWPNSTASVSSDPGPIISELFRGGHLQLLLSHARTADVLELTSSLNGELAHDCTLTNLGFAFGHVVFMCLNVLVCAGPPASAPKVSKKRPAASLLQPQKKPLKKKYVLIGADCFYAMIVIMVYSLRILAVFYRQLYLCLDHLPTCP